MRLFATLLALAALTTLTACYDASDYSSMTKEEAYAAEAQRRAMLNSLKNLGALLDDSYQPSTSYSSDSYTGYRPDPYASSYGASGDDCYELQASFNEAYQDFHDTGSTCAIYMHEYRVRNAYRDALVNNGCTSAAAWDSGIMIAHQGARESC